MMASHRLQLSLDLKKKKKDTDLTAFILADILNEQQPFPLPKASLQLPWVLYNHTKRPCLMLPALVPRTRRCYTNELPYPFGDTASLPSQGIVYYSSQMSQAG